MELDGDHFIDGDERREILDYEIYPISEHRTEIVDNIEVGLDGTWGYSEELFLVRRGEQHLVLEYRASIGRAIVALVIE